MVNWREMATRIGPRVRDLIIGAVVALLLYEGGQDFWFLHKARVAAETQAAAQALIQKAQAQQAAQQKAAPEKPQP